MTRIRLIAVAAVVLACTPVGAIAQQAGAPGSALADQLAESSLRMVGSLFAVLALVALCAWLLRRWRDRQGVENGSIEVVSGITLGSKERIVLLRVGDEQVLVGVSPAGMRSLHVVRQQLPRDVREPALAKQDGARLTSPELSNVGSPNVAPSNVASANVAASSGVAASASPSQFRLSLGAAQ